MPLEICNGVLDRINQDSFQTLLKRHELPFSGKKHQAISRINQAIDENRNGLSVEVFDAFIAEEIRHGRSRLLFVCDIISRQARNMQNEQFVTSALEDSNLGDHDFNCLRNDIDIDSGWNVLYRKVEVSGNSVDLVDLCYAKAEQVNYIIYTDNGEETRSRKQIDYVWVTIVPGDSRIIVKLWNKQGNSVESISNSRVIFEEISSNVCEVFGLTKTTRSSDVKSTLYKMFKDLTETAEKPFRDKVETISREILEFSTVCSQRLELPSSIDPVNIPHRIERLLERALIQADMGLYKRFFEGKRGVVERVAFSDQTGAYVNARSGEPQGGISVADIYFDTRETIDELRLLDKLWITWFYLVDDADRPEEVNTKIEVFKDYYIINFQYAYTTREVEELVLSNFKHYEALPD